MNVRLLTWNMGYLKQKKEIRSQVWDYLDNKLCPDIALLQEAVPPENRYSSNNKVFLKVEERDKWSSGIISKTFRLITLDLVTMINMPKKFRYSVVAADISQENSSILGKNVKLTAISIYNNINELWGATGNLHIILSYLTPLLLNKFGKREFIIGGDLNTSLQWENQNRKWRGMSQKILFGRIKDFDLINCTEKLCGQHVQTYRDKRSDVHWQNDYLFVSTGLERYLVSCDVVDNPEVQKLSDHYPLVLEIAF